MIEYTKHIKMLASVLDEKDFISPDRTEELLNSVRGGVHLSIDGNCGCALLGVNLQEGEAEFVEIDEAEKGDGYMSAANRATVRALRKLTARCYPEGNKSLPYYTGDHPFFGA
ncbi:MAG: hypothetical protein COA96_10315 [SAR86 cluster bacterium]|uniref:Uncharacterized protein n=1 Tax=SAR86 cluster bacterium TaxID=2030880 RepID=A0A2A5AYC3_9GAMM|nr:MAG: hypothetical protein COA96_10315 [SAR86 cluster bacterium]